MTATDTVPRQAPRPLQRWRRADRPAVPSEVGGVQYDPRRWRALPVILVATFMSLFDIFVVNVAAPSIQSDLHSSSAGLELVVGGYSFTYAAGLVTGGRLGDRFGRRRMFIAGMLLFAAASALCGVAPNPSLLVVGRLLQGVGAAGMVPQVLAMITVGFPPEERPQAFALFGVTVGIGSVSGQILGGVLLDLNILNLGWRPIFLVNVPIGIVAALLARRLVRESRAATAEKLDPVGLVTLSGGLGLALIPLVLGRSEGWPLWTWVALGAAVVVLAGFVAWEARLASNGGHPIVPPALLRRRQVSAGLVVNLCFFAFFGSFLLALTIFLQDGQHLSPLRAGLTFAPLGVAFALASIAARRLGTRYGSWVLTAGAAISLAGVVGFFLLVGASGVHASTGVMIPLLVLAGIGNGLVIPSLVGTVLQGVPPDISGAVSGVLATTQQFAAALGIAGIGAVFFTELSRSGPAAALHAALLGDVVALVLAVAATLLLPRPARVRKEYAVQID